MTVTVDGIRAILDQIDRDGAIIKFLNPHTEESWKVGYSWKTLEKYFSPARITRGSFRDLIRDCLAGVL